MNEAFADGESHRAGDSGWQRDQRGLAAMPMTVKGYDAHTPTYGWERITLSFGAISPERVAVTFPNFDFGA
ncbi:MAG: hypothetical protein ACRDZO_05625 [Egibacteraceae bacterium]